MLNGNNKNNIIVGNFLKRKKILMAEQGKMVGVGHYGEIWWESSTSITAYAKNVRPDAMLCRHLSRKCHGVDMTCTNSKFEDTKSYEVKNLVHL